MNQERPGVIPIFCFRTLIALVGSINLNRHARSGGHLRFVAKQTEIPALAGMTGYGERIRSRLVKLSSFERDESALDATFFQKNCGKRFWSDTLESNLLAKSV